jgi:hypothetical protein
METSLDNTPCKNCFFAEYKDITQVGCNAKQLDKFKLHGITILEAYDAEKEFYVVEGRKCLYYRPLMWGENKDNPVASAREEIKFNYHAIIRCASDSVQEVEKTVDSLTNADIPPAYITCIVPYKSTSDGKEYIPILKGQSADWNIEKITNPEIGPDREVTFCVKRVPSAFIFIVNDGCEIPKDTFNKLDTKIVEQLWTFTLILPNDKGNGVIFPWGVYRYWQLTGDPSKSIIDNIKDAECPQIHQINDLVPNFPT